MISIAWKNGETSGTQETSKKRLFVKIFLGILFFVSLLVGSALFFAFKRPVSANEPKNLGEPPSLAVTSLETASPTSFQVQSRSVVTEQNENKLFSPFAVCVVVFVLLLGAALAVLAHCFCAAAPVSEEIEALPELEVGVEEAPENSCGYPWWYWWVPLLGVVLLFVGLSCAYFLFVKPQRSTFSKFSPEHLEKHEENQLDELNIQQQKQQQPKQPHQPRIMTDEEDEDAQPLPVITFHSMDGWFPGTVFRNPAGKRDIVAIQTPKGVGFFPVNLSYRAILRAFKAEDPHINIDDYTVLEGIVLYDRKLIFPLSHVFSIIDKRVDYEMAFENCRLSAEQYIAWKASSASIVSPSFVGYPFLTRYRRFIVENFDRFEKVLQAMKSQENRRANSRLFKFLDERHYDIGKMTVYWTFPKDCIPWTAEKYEDDWAPRLVGVNIVDHYRTRGASEADQAFTKELEAMMEEFNGYSHVH